MSEAGVVFDCLKSEQYAINLYKGGFQLEQRVATLRHCRCSSLLNDSKGKLRATKATISQKERLIY